jgi:type III secretion protein T
MPTDFASLYAMDPAKLMALLAMCSTRTMVALSMLPLFSSRTVPVMIRSGLVIAVIFPVVFKHLDNTLPTELTALWFITFLGKEGGIGFMIGLGFGAFFAGLQTAGEIIDHQTGLTFTQNIDPMHGNNVSITAQFLDRILFAALMAAGAMLTILDTLYLSYEVWPVGEFTPALNRLTSLQLVGQASKLFALSLLLAGPVLLVLFVVDVSLGLLNRAAPQLHISNITMAIKATVGLAVLAMALPMITDRVIVALKEVAATLNQFLLTAP